MQETLRLTVLIIPFNKMTFSHNARFYPPSRFVFTIHLPLTGHYTLRYGFNRLEDYQTFHLSSRSELWLGTNLVVNLGQQTLNCAHPW